MAASFDENRPADLNTRRAGPGLDVDKDKLVIKYTGAGRHANDVASIQSNKPAPLDCRVYYFEVAVLDGGEHSRIGVGFGSQDFPTNKQPGCASACIPSLILHIHLI
jgi:Ran-binding protein 9/10